MIFTFGNYTVDIDIEKTRKTYEKLPLVSQRCSCDDCKNFEKAVDSLSSSVRSFFDTVGVDLKKIAECYVNGKNEDSTLLYGGFCHVCGTMIQGTGAWVNVSENHSCYDPALAYSLDEHFRVSFQEQCLMVDAEFEGPLLQIELEATIPQV